MPIYIVTNNYQYPIQSQSPQSWTIGDQVTTLAFLPTPYICGVIACSRSPSSAVFSGSLIDLFPPSDFFATYRRRIPYTEFLLAILIVKIQRPAVIYTVASSFTSFYLTTQHSRNVPSTSLFIAPTSSSVGANFYFCFYLLDLRVSAIQFSLFIYWIQFLVPIYIVCSRTRISNRIRLSRSR